MAAMDAIAGRYRPDRKLGEGAFGAVYRCRDTQLEREVAVKVLTATHHDEVAKRFEREARLTARLEHPHVVKVFESGVTADGRPFLVYELVDGEELTPWIDGRREVAPARRLAWAVAGARALAYAHARGVLHRDVKPSNAMVRRDGTLLLCDFGLGRDTETTRTALTQAGFLLGTPRYVSREVVLGKPITAAADQFAWAATVYELFAGRPLREARDQALPDFLMEIATRTQHELPPSFAGEHPALAPILRRALAPDPADRFPDMATFADALASVEVGADGSLHATGSFAPLPDTPSGRGRVVAGIGFLVLALAAAVVPGGEEAAPPAPLVASVTPGSAGAPPDPAPPLAKTWAAELEALERAGRRLRKAWRKGEDRDRLWDLSLRDLEERILADDFVARYREVVRAWTTLAVDLAAARGPGWGRALPAELEDESSALVRNGRTLWEVGRGVWRYHTEAGEALFGGESADFAESQRLTEILEALEVEAQDAWGQLSLLEGDLPDEVFLGRAVLRASFGTGDPREVGEDLLARLASPPPRVLTRLMVDVWRSLYVYGRYRVPDCGGLRRASAMFLDHAKGEGPLARVFLGRIAEAASEAVIVCSAESPPVPAESIAAMEEVMALLAARAAAGDRVGMRQLVWGEREVGVFALRKKTPELLAMRDRLLDLLHRTLDEEEIRRIHEVLWGKPDAEKGREEGGG